MKKRIVITGASRGIGLGLAKALAGAGHDLFLVARDRERLKVAAEEMHRQSPSMSLRTMSADLSSMQEVYRCAGEIASQWPAIDVLVINHAAIFTQAETTREGLQAGFALNFLSYILLLQVLLPCLVRNLGGRIVILSAEAHRAARIDFDNLQNRPAADSPYNSVDDYCRAKLALIMYSRAFARHTSASRPDIFCVHPGSMYTDSLDTLRSEYTRLTGSSDFPEAMTVAEGMSPLVRLATDSALEGTGWGYFIKDEPADPSEFALDDASGNRLYEITNRMLDGWREGMMSPGITRPG